MGEHGWTGARRSCPSACEVCSLAAQVSSGPNDFRKLGRDPVLWPKILGQAEKYFRQFAKLGLPMYSAVII